ncbi:ABC transporter ATP-binding protein [Alteromonas sp. CYL-A6]|uniref:ABC transporter ATP-binding protein n=1 Tax=Alteromonas nitratireducens TaxID=3390813 RepID=UPI0034AB6C37
MPEPTATATHINALTFSYGKQQPVVLDIPHWQIPRGQHIFLSGDSGSGKSTLLNLIAGTLTPTSGDITLMDAPFSVLPARRRDRLRAEHIGIVFQQLNLISYLTVQDNIAAAAYFAGRDYQHLETRIAALLDQLALPERVLKQQASELSVGQQQRVAIARALINAPALLIVDEPTSALDTRARDAFMDVLITTAADSAMLFVSHDPGLAGHFSHQQTMTALNRAHVTEAAV